MLDPIMEPQVCGPVVAIFEEAGGSLGDWRGNRTISGREGLATNGALQREVLGLLAMCRFGCDSMDRTGLSLRELLW